MEPEPIITRDYRYSSLTTSLAILLFLPTLFLITMLSRVMDMASGIGMELSSITVLLGNHPRVTLIAAFVLMLCTIIFAWSGRRAGILAALALLFQGIAIFLLLAATIMPMNQMLKDLSA
jgi:hypothetical protein